MSNSIPGAVRKLTIGQKLDDYGEDKLFDDLYNGLQIQELAEMLGLSTTSRIYVWLYETPERKLRFKQFRESMSDQLVTQAIDIADTMDVDNGFAPVVKAKEQISIRKWVASAWNREQDGQTQIPANIQQINIGSLHLQAITAEPQAQPQELIPEAEITEIPPSEGFD